jgi:hypothetical protein
VIAHVGGVPVEEALLPFAGGAGAGLILLGRARVLSCPSVGFRAPGGSLFRKRQSAAQRPESEKHDGLGIHSDT